MRMTSVKPIIQGHVVVGAGKCLFDRIKKAFTRPYASFLLECGSLLPHSIDTSKAKVFICITIDTRRLGHIYEIQLVTKHRFS